MAISIITQLPLYADTEYSYATTFGTTEVIVEVFYNSRSKAWHIDISDSGFTYLAQGLKLIPGVLHGADFSLDAYGIKGYLVLEPVTPNLKWEDIDPEGIYQYYNLFYVEAT